MKKIEKAQKILSDMNKITMIKDVFGAYRNEMRGRKKKKDSDYYLGVLEEVTNNF